MTGHQFDRDLEYSHEREKWKPPKQPQAKTGHKALIRLKTPLARVFGRVAWCVILDTEERHMTVRWTRGHLAGHEARIPLSSIAECLRYE